MYLLYKTLHCAAKVVNLRFEVIELIIYTDFNDLISEQTVIKCMFACAKRSFCIFLLI